MSEVASLKPSTLLKMNSFQDIFADFTTVENSHFVEQFSVVAFDGRLSVEVLGHHTCEKQKYRCININEIEDLVYLMEFTINYFPPLDFVK